LFLETRMDQLLEELAIFSSDEGILANWTEPVDHSVYHLADGVFYNLELEDNTNIKIFLNDELVNEFYEKAIEGSLNFDEEGNYTIRLLLEQGEETLSLSRNIVVIKKEVITKDAPVNIQSGLNYVGDSTLIIFNQILITECKPPLMKRIIG